jgi:hypothetical protein
VADESDRILVKLDELGAAVADLRVAVARLEERAAAPVPPPTKPGIVRDGSMTAAGGVIGAALAALLDHLAK